ncbi:hypothetical protein OIU84_027895 [Salix udensis]|uniref:Bifunctional inhibitor/plant lipid transfer protein/seed storage helical domain-containing protein n=1 Tax=Salix udensis TaxID=889485 RepID=A0AAD6P8T0_9ROSI|nr:hypothetical protein OIU84_027895 [Salix udensis]
MATKSLPFPASSNTSYLLLEPAMLRFAGCCFLLLLLVSGLDFAYSESQCELVFEYFPYCLEFLTGNYYKPSKRCCGHIYKLNRLANRGLGARADLLVHRIHGEGDGASNNG